MSTPAQAAVSATLTGAAGYSAHLETRPLDAPGSLQIKAPFTVAGDYSKTLIVDGATGEQTATVSPASAATRPRPPSSLCATTSGRLKLVGDQLPLLIGPRDPPKLMPASLTAG